MARGGDVRTSVGGEVVGEMMRLFCGGLTDAWLLLSCCQEAAFAAHVEHL